MFVSFVLLDAYINVLFKILSIVIPNFPAVSQCIFHLSLVQDTFSAGLLQLLPDMIFVFFNLLAEDSVVIV